ncbi:MAG: hypothetical protein LBU91_00105, partial [Bacteroidales bacterium]|nr:hypothetical protein [Bacteroidales bacterium]
RTREAGHKPARRMVDVRREGNRIIRLMYSQIEMLLLTETTELPALTQFANELNAENSRVSANLNRKGKRENENEELVGR